MSDREELLRAARAARAARGDTALSPAAFAAGRTAPAPPGRLRFSLMFFSALADDRPRADAYRLVREAAVAADRDGFDAVWLPERHFHPFGGPYPNPAVLAAALAPLTRRVRLRAGSVILPLWHPARVAEMWAMVDNLSGGRVDLAFGSGWNPDDFVLAPASFPRAKELSREGIEHVRRLWRGEAVAWPNGVGTDTPVRTYPRPVQAELPVWLTALSPATFRAAGANGFHVLTMMLGCTPAELAERTAAYRDARREAGLDPAGGQVTLMLHTYVDPDAGRAESLVREPFLQYLRSSLDLHKLAAADAAALANGQADQVAGFAFERYRATAALFGPPAACDRVLESVHAAGVTEVACLIDFGVPEDRVLESLTHLNRLRERWGGGLVGRVESPRPGVVPVSGLEEAARPTRTGDIAVIGMAGRFPGADDPAALWERIAAGRPAFGPAPAGRAVLPGTSGFAAGVDEFDPLMFKISPLEAEAMDPHQRVFLETVRAAVADSGLSPEAAAGRAVGVFAAVYSPGHRAAVAEAAGGPVPLPDALAVTGGVHAMVPNRVSFVFDWSGPSEVVDTACSSGLVAVHRAVRALRAGECELAVAGGVSLLLSVAESEGLARLGVLSKAGACRPFDAAADGQVRGEGAAAVVLKPLDRALADGDPIHAVVRGSAVNHAGGRSGSPTLPNPARQAACVQAAWRDAGIDPRSVGLIEAHGAGSPAGDLAEVAALATAFGEAGGPPGGCRIGAVKAVVGSLDAAGGLAGFVAAVLALKHATLPGVAGFRDAAQEMDFAAGPLRVASTSADWPAGPVPRRAGVHAYGLGGTNAHVVLEEAPAPAGPRRPHGPPPAFRRRRFPLPTPKPDTPMSPEAPMRTYVEKLRQRAEPPAPAPTAGDDLPARLTAHLGAALADVLKLRPDDLGPRTPFADLGVTSLSGVRFLDRVNREFDLRLGVETVFEHPTLAALAGFLCDRHRPAVAAVLGSPAPPAARPVPPPANPVAAFYDYASRSGLHSFEETYVTLAPFPEIVPGFSWTRTFREPEKYREHYDLTLRRQREMREVFFAPVDFSRAKRVLDFGCGFATDVITLAKKHPHLEAVGYTVSPEQAKAGQSRVREQRLDGRVTVYNRDSGRDEFPGLFDVIFGVEVAHHIEDKEALFGNIGRNLRPGGHLLLVESVANTLAPINLPHIGSYTTPKAEYAAILARHQLRIDEVIDVSQEIANFMEDPHLDATLAAERREADRAGRGDRFRVFEEFNKAWNNYGQALRLGVVLYLLIAARKDTDAPAAELERVNRGHLGADR